MDVFENRENFYDVGIDTRRPAVVGDNEYFNANAASQANVYMAKHPVTDPNNKAKIEGAIIDLQNEIKIAQAEKNKCPKNNNVWGIISGSLTGGITAGLSERCKNQAQAKIDGASQVINTYQQMLQDLNLASTQAAQDAAQAKLDAANVASSGITTPINNAPASSGTMWWILGGLGVLIVGGVLVFAFTGHKKTAPAA